MADNNKKKGLIRKIQDFLASYKGKVILNYGYSWGAAVVIMGTLFKLVHLPGANLMLFVGMGTEVLVFFVSAFDRPAKTYKWETVFPNLQISGSDYSKKQPSGEEGSVEGMTANIPGNVFGGQMQGMPQQGAAGPIIIGGGYPMGGGAVSAGTATAAVEVGAVGGNTVAGAAFVGAVSPGVGGETPTGNVGGMQGFVGGGVISVGGGSGAVTPGVEVSPEMEEATQAYLEQLKGMTEALNHFVEQTKTLGQDAEQINILNKNLTGINAVYEIQLRNISTQLGTIDEINEQTRRMACQIEELNHVYARMLEAMTVNMRNNSN